MSDKILSRINSPSDLKLVCEEDIPVLCDEIREFLIDNVGRQGGHLSSNLGICELTVAMHRVFDSPNDHFIFDVGHQSYVHKIITGRREAFSTLRRSGGLSGFTSMQESEHDAFGAGHSSTSISSALGYAEADRLKGSDNYTVAVLGDGAFTGGMVHEALNNCDPNLKLIIILNENGMSISVNKGRFASYLSGVRISKGYRSFKKNTKSAVSKIPLIGKPLSRFLTFVKTKFKNLFLASNYFEDLGLYYIGGVDGNNYKKVKEALIRAKELGKCVVVHVKTQKGKGYLPAEMSPDGFHSVYKSEPKVERLDADESAEYVANGDSFHSEFVDELITLAKEDDKVVAITAAMGIGTGLARFGECYPERYFDVGIAEDHALTFSAGLCANGYKPFVDIYSTFLQRGYDSIIHDVCLQNLPVRIVIDRASLAVSDGPTHHGIFDVAFLSHIPNMRVLAPITYKSLREATRIALNSDTPIAIRYPNASEDKAVTQRFNFESCVGEFGLHTDFSLTDKPQLVFVTYGSIVSRVVRASDILRSRGFSVGIVLLEQLKPYDAIAERVYPYVFSASKILFVEEGVRAGGAGMLLCDALTKINSEISLKYSISAIDNSFASPRGECDLYKYLSLDENSLAERMLSEQK